MSRIFVVLLFFAGCAGTDPAPVDAQREPDASVASDMSTIPDLGETVDGDIGVEDIGLVRDFGSNGEDQGGGGEPLPGFGMLSGDCGVLDDELTVTQSFFVQNVLDFGTDPYDDADLTLLTPGGQEIIADGNAGGNSLLSEVFAYEVLARCEGAVLLKTETEVTYLNDMGKITDLLVELDGLRIGVSVTRALAFPFEDPYTPQQAETLLTDKLGDILLSTANVAPEDAWEKQILHVLAYSEMHADSLRTAYEGLDPSVTSDTVVVVTVTNGADDPLY